MIAKRAKKVAEDLGEVESVALVDVPPVKKPEDDRPTCPVCSVKKGEAVYLKRVQFRESEDVYACPEANCRFTRCVFVDWNPPAPTCCTIHHLDADRTPQVCVEIPDGKPERAYRRTRRYRCPLPNCRSVYSLTRPSAVQRQNWARDKEREATIAAALAAKAKPEAPAIA